MSASSSKKTEESEPVLFTYGEEEDYEVVEPSENLDGIRRIRIFFNNPESERTLLNIIQRQAVICENIRADSDNVNDTIFCELYQDDPSLDNKDLFHLFWKDYVPGMKMAPNFTAKKKLVLACVAAGKAWDDSMKHSPSNLREVMSSSLYVDPPMIEASESMEEMSLDSSHTVDPKSSLGKQLKVYRQALVNYYLSDGNKTGISTKDNDKSRNVRFLRDTTENIISFAQHYDGYVEPNLLEEIQNVYTTSVIHDRHLSKGHGRRFDPPTVSKPGTNAQGGRGSTSGRRTAKNRLPPTAPRALRESARQSRGKQREDSPKDKYGYRENYERHTYEEDGPHDSRDSRDEEYHHSDRRESDHRERIERERRSYREREAYEDEDENPVWRSSGGAMLPMEERYRNSRDSPRKRRDRGSSYDTPRR
ncbi:hypothetical protein N7490_001252 [Penicillium lividum]|nr:hypothetical protein N7490_001252 [Penicillium lividum]